MKYKVGDRVRIKSLDWYYNNRDRIDEVACGNTNFIPDMVKYCEGIVTISSILPTLKIYHIKEDGGMFYWIDEMIEGLVEEDVDLIPKFGEFSDNEPLDIPTMTTDFIKEHGFPRPEGYIFKDENGNVINTTKIVLEKKKKEYPKTYEECCKELNIAVRDLDILDNMLDTTEIIYSKNLDRLLNSFRKLLVCRDAYWKIAGEEIGLGKPWEPDYDSLKTKYTIVVVENKVVKLHTLSQNHILTFPTEEMRDAFRESEEISKLIEECKEFL